MMFSTPPFAFPHVPPTPRLCSPHAPCHVATSRLLSNSLAYFHSSPSLAHMTTHLPRRLGPGKQVAEAEKVMRFAFLFSRGLCATGGRLVEVCSPACRCRRREYERGDGDALDWNAARGGLSLRALWGRLRASTLLSSEQLSPTTTTTTSSFSFLFSFFSFLFSHPPHFSGRVANANTDTGQTRRGGGATRARTSNSHPHHQAK